MRSTENTGLHRFAIITAASTFVLLIAGGLVTSTGSGLAVPDWPLSYGMLFPPMVGGILYEHGHRLIAGIVALMTVALAIWTWKRDSRATIRRLALVAVLAVFLQALLGGLTVLFFLPTAISVGHFALASAFFCIVGSLALFTSPAWQRMNRRQTSSAFLRMLSLIAVGVVYVQMLLGAWMRHSGAGLAIPDFPLSYGTLVPSFTPEALEGFNRTLIYDVDLPRATLGQVGINYAHRVGALLAAAILIALVVQTYRRYRNDNALVGLASVLAFLLVTQIALGAVTVWSRKSVVPTTAHVVVGPLLLATSLAFVLLERRRYLVEPAVAFDRSSQNEGVRV
jgi:cytochrome c oxidase assembly protein subunit 15